MATHTTLQVQPSPMPTYNHPCGDLLDGGSRRDYLDVAVPLYRASMAGDLKAAKAILAGREYLVRYSINENKETPLHVAAGAGRYNVVSYLVDMMSKVDLELQNIDGNTAFCIALLVSGNVSVIEIMSRKNPALLIIPGGDNMMPLYLAAFHGDRDIVTFLYKNLKRDRTIGETWTDDFMDGVLLKCIQADIFDVALLILEDNLQLPQEKHVWNMLQVLARKPRMFNEITNPIVSFLVRIRLRILLVGYSEQNDATLLLRLLWTRIMENPKDVIDKILRGPMIEKDGKETYPSQILFLAAKMNNTRFLIELISEYPDLVSKTNDDGQTIFHISVYHRHHDIYMLLYETGSMRDPITSMTDHEGNNILHLVGKKVEENKVNIDTLSTPFQMHSEFLWYKEVKGIVPPPYRDVKNTAGETPYELFTKNHEKLVSVGMKLMNETINVSMVVAALVCTIGFAVAYSIPGGFHQQTGFPMFLNNKYFIAFVIFDVISFLLSTSSIFVFLFIVLYGSHNEDMGSLLERWVTGQMLLLSSILSLVMAFLLSLLVLYLQSSHAYVIYIFAYYGIGTYAVACFVFALDAVTTINGVGFLFRRKRLVLRLYRKKIN